MPSSETDKSISIQKVKSSKTPHFFRCSCLILFNIVYSIPLGCLFTNYQTKDLGLRSSSKSKMRTLASNKFLQTIKKNHINPPFKYNEKFDN